MKVDKGSWSKHTIQEVCAIQLGTRIVKKQTEPGQYFVYGGGDATFTTQQYNREDSIVVARFALSKECTRFVKGKFFLNDSGLSLIPKNQTLDSDYLKWHIFGLNDKIYDLARGAAQKNLNMKRFPLLPLNMPPIAEQESIAAELDALQEVIDGYREQIADLDALAQSIFLDTFGDPITNPKGWEVKKFHEVCDSQLGKMINQQTQSGELKPFLCAVNVQDNDFYLKALKYFCIKEDEKEKFQVMPGDLMICEGGDTGRCAIFNKNIEIYYQKSVHRVRSSKMSLYIVMFILKHYKSIGLLEEKSNGATIQHLTQKTLNQLSLIVPPLELQQQFAMQVESIEKQKDLLRQQLADAEMLMAERLQYYFS